MRATFRCFSRLVLSIGFAVVLAVPATAQGGSSEGDRLFAAAKFNQAADAYTEASHRNPKDVSLHLALVRTFLRLDNTRWRDAIREGRAAVALAPNNTDAHGLLALALMRGGQPEAAGKEAERALALSGNSYYGLVAMGRLDLWNEQKAEARKVLQHALQLHPERPDAYCYLLQTFDHKDREEANKIGAAYLKLDPKGHPHDQLIDVYRNSDFEKKWHARRIAFNSRSPFTTDQMQDADAGTGRPVAYTTSIERAGDDIILPVTINGVEFHLMFDTGAGNGIVLGSDALNRVTLRPVGRSISLGVSGKEASKIYRADTMSVGPQSFSDQYVEGLENNVGRADGLIGGANFDDSAITFDFQQNTLTVARGKNAVAPPALEGDHLMTVPFHLIGSYIFVPIRLADRTQTEWGMLDTGAEGMGVLSLLTARELAKQESDDAIKEVTIDRRIGVGTTAPSFTALLFRFAVDLALVNNGGTPFFMEMNPIYGASMIDQQLCRYFDFQLSAIVGISYLASARRITIDYPHHLLTMEFAN